MGILKNPRHDVFAQEYARRGNATQAYITAGYSSRGAEVSGARLLRNAKVQSRIAEIQAQLCERTLKLEIRDRNARIAAYQDRWDRLKAVIEARSKDPENLKVAGGETGLIVITQYKVESSTELVDGKLQKVTSLTPEFAVDTGLLKELREHERQAAQELGQWTEQQDLNVKGTVTVADVLRRRRAKCPQQ